MLPLENLLLIVPTLALLVILPGPDFALVSRVALLDGASAGKAAACGVALGMCMHTAFAIAGISAIIATSALLFALLKYLGAAYLCWLGIQAFRQSSISTAKVEIHAGVQESRRRAPLRRAFRQGFLANALNPKAVLIFLTLLPQFMVQDIPPTLQLLEMGTINAVLCLVWFLFLAQVLGRARRAFGNPRFQRWLHRLTGTVFLAFGIRLAAAQADRL
ncbi:LysE family translocator [uncultured Desulfovibrio sp.]|uniref:LysE family translocator n=1 Tax=uncultured Desulfovibrio sp. TaxID=167968 RepID=UPI0025CC79FC|nr:LysE family transporter [uncultured Desulfovibrio sp.]